ncbi:MAG TPA: LemA family protein [Spirochaetota bacterium]|nr:LemA family protein [Spirochaetota bacterium]
MNKSSKILLIVLGSLAAVFLLLAIIIFSSIKSTYNGAMERQENVKNQWANVETAYQRRMDLIPNLVNTVKGYASHEKETLQAVTEARAKARQTTIDANNLDAEALKKFQAAQSGLSSALSRLMMVQERYPDLKANQNFLALQSQLEGTENRISVARTRFNEAVKQYNIFIRGFFRRMIISMFYSDEFERLEPFKAQKGAEKAPEVKFD